MHFILRYLPILLACSVILFPLCLWCLSASLAHINPILPYVSDLGIVPPEASLFSLCMCTGSALVALFVLVRHDLNRSFVHRSTFVSVQEQSKGNSEQVDANTEVVLLKQARRSLISGLCMSVGFLLVGTFRNNETELVQLLHNVFAAFAFSCALADIYYEHRIASEMAQRHTARYRCVILGLCLVFLVVYSSSAVASLLANPTAFLQKQARLRWSSREPGYSLHVLSTSVEWMLIYMLSPYFYTFHSHFARATYLGNNNGQAIP